MRSASELDYRLDLYAWAWIEERLCVTRELGARVRSRVGQVSVHDLRVSCRRLREALAVFDGVLGIPDVFAIDDGARALARSVRRLRELDVSAKTLTSMRLTDPRAKQAALVLARAMRERRTDLAKKRRAKIARRLKKLERAVERHWHKEKLERAPGSEGELRAFLETQVHDRQTTVEELAVKVLRRAESGQPADPRKLHAIRVAVKHWRYAYELARGLVPRVLYRPMATKLRSLQNLGGLAQDGTDLLRTAERTASSAPGLRKAWSVLLPVLEAREQAASAQFVSGLRELLTRGASPARQASTTSQTT
jgi:CHAD domain-containing protein